MSHIWIEATQHPQKHDAVPLRHLCQVSNISLGKSIVDKTVASLCYRLSDPMVVSVRPETGLMGWKRVLTWLGIPVCCYGGLVLARRPYLRL